MGGPQQSVLRYASRNSAHSTECLVVALGRRVWPDEQPKLSPSR
jgi:hypothetical protein